MNHSTEDTVPTVADPSQPLPRAKARRWREPRAFRNLSLPRKFSLLLLALMVPLIGLSALVGYDRWHAITGAEAAISGVPYLAGLRQLIEHLPQHRLLMREALDGQPHAEAKLVDKRGDIAAAIATLEQLDSQQTALLSGSPVWSAFRADWISLIESREQRIFREIITLHDRLLFQVTLLLNDIGARSGLLRDAELETHRLASLAIDGLPLLIEKTTQLRRTALGLSDGRTATELERVLLATILHETEHTLARMRANLESAFTENPALRAQLEGHFTTLEHSAAAFQQRLRATAGAEAGVTMAHAEVAQLSNELLGNTHTFYTAALSSLTQQLNNRIAGDYTWLSLEIFMLAAGLLLCTYLFHSITRSVVVRLRHAGEVFQRLGAGQFSNRIAVDSDDEIGGLLRALAKLQAKLGADRMQMQRRATEIGRLKSALDSASAGILVTDKDYTITYVNPALLRTMERHGAVLSRHIPGFSAGRIIGLNVNALVNQSAAQQHLAPTAQGAYRSRMEFESAVFELTANPILDAKGEQVGVVLEWDDQSEQGAVEREIQQIVSAAVNGDLTQRLRLEGKSGFQLQLAKDLNRLTESIGQLVEETTAIMAAVARGDLTRQLTTDCGGAFGELSCNINATVTTLTDMIAKIRSAAEDVRNGSTEIAQANLDLSQRTEEQAANLQVSAANITQLTQIVRTNVETAHNVNKLATRARDNAEIGGEAVKKAVTAMSQINASSAKMEDIIGAIDELAFQTNLLALNAAVEAARAGDQGRGFAVVANEVRSLAQRSAAAAREIKDLIEDSRSKVANGTQLVHDSGETLEKIITSVKQVGDMIAQISNGGDEQLSSIEEASNAIRQIDNATQQNAASVEQTAAASKALGDQAHSLTELVAFFNVAHGTSDPTKHQALVLQPPRATSPRPVVERRQSSRPWSQPHAAQPAPATMKKAVGDHDASAEWESF